LIHHPDHGVEQPVLIPPDQVTERSGAARQAIGNQAAVVGVHDRICTWDEPAGGKVPATRRVYAARHAARESITNRDRAIDGGPVKDPTGVGRGVFGSGPRTIQNWPPPGQAHRRRSIRDLAEARRGITQMLAALAALKSAKTGGRMIYAFGCQEPFVGCRPPGNLDPTDN
jgi:hypothetical protein